MRPTVYFIILMFKLTISIIKHRMKYSELNIYILFVNLNFILKLLIIIFFYI